ncbi:MAG: hypothetical protein J7L86_01090 [Candidatus Marinimicrobia bacterium]|nr:hypothetical protein [Candidatus Neomarinimicrobiota bacterium]
MKVRFRIFMLMFVCGIIAQGGEYADSFLETGVSARALAMANATGALDRSATSFSSNPAGLAFVRQTQVGLMYTSQFGLANHNYIGLALPLSEKSSGAVSWVRFGVDDIPIRPDILREVTDPAARRDSIIALQNYPFKTFSDLEDAFFISYARHISKSVSLGWRYSRFTIEIPWGINFKIIYKKLYNLEAYGIGIDIGGRLCVSGEELFEIKKLGKLNVGLALKDATGTVIYWNTKRQDEIRFYPVFSFGLEQTIEKYHMHLNVGIEKDYRHQDKMRYGLECIVKDKISFRAGINKTGITTGLGLIYKVMNRIINTDYTFFNHDLGATHRIGVGIEL